MREPPSQYGYGPDVTAHDELVAPNLPGSARPATARRRYRMSDEDAENIPSVIAAALSAELGVTVKVDVEFPVPGGPGIVIVKDRGGREINVDPTQLAAIAQQSRIRPPRGASLEGPSLSPPQRALVAFDDATTDGEKLAVVLDYLASR